MKRKMRFSIMLTLSLLLSLVSLPQTAQAAPPQRFRGDTGVVALGAAQILRVVVGEDGNGATAGAVKVRIRWMQYMPQGCMGTPAVCRHAIASEGVTPIETLGSGDALSFDLQQIGDGVRVVVESNSPNVWVTGIVFDTSTQKVTGTFQTEMLS